MWGCVGCVCVGGGGEVYMGGEVCMGGKVCMGVR